MSNTPAVSAKSWAKRYLEQLGNQANSTTTPKEIAQRLLAELRPVSLEGWKDTETLLSREMIRHQVDSKLIDPWEISKDVHDLFQKALQGYAEQLEPAKLAVQLADQIGTVRQKYSAVDARVIGFISMQFFYTGRNLLALLPDHQRSQVNLYFNVISDHLYMPLKRAFTAAGKHPSSSPDLQIVHKLVPNNTAIAQRIVAKTLQSQSTYRCHSGLLTDAAIQVSSVRDVEMFQIYLWVCILEGNLDSIQEELFPLCVMLYPRLRVGWELVRQMLFLISQEFQTVLSPEQMKVVRPYYQELWEMFSPEVFPDMVYE